MSLLLALAVLLPDTGHAGANTTPFGGSAPNGVAPVPVPTPPPARDNGEGDDSKGKADVAKALAIVGAALAGAACAAALAEGKISEGLAQCAQAAQSAAGAAQNDDRGKQVTMDDPASSRVAAESPAAGEATAATQNETDSPQPSAGSAAEEHYVPRVQESLQPVVGLPAQKSSGERENRLLAAPSSPGAPKTSTPPIITFQDNDSTPAGAAAGSALAGSYALREVGTTAFDALETKQARTGGAGEDRAAKTGRADLDGRRNATRTAEGSRGEPGGKTATEVEMEASLALLLGAAPVHAVVAAPKGEIVVLPSDEGVPNIFQYATYRYHTWKGGRREPATSVTGPVNKGLTGAGRNRSGAPDPGLRSASYVGVTGSVAAGSPISLQ